MADKGGHGRLLRILGVGFGIAIAVGNMVGAGIMRAPSSMAAAVPNGPLLIGLWVLGAGINLLAINIWAELATAIPRDGGIYAYAKRAFGDVTGLAVGWTLWMTITSSSAALSIAFADFLGSVWPVSAGTRIGIAAALLLLLAAYNAVGLREGRLATGLTSALKALGLLLFVIAAVVFAPHIHTAASLHPLAIAAPLGFAGIVAAYQLIDGAYAGWDAPAAFGAENSDPGRAIPRALFGGFLITAVIFILVMLALLHSLGAQGLAATPLPFAYVTAQLIGPASGMVVAALAMLILASCANANMLIAPRVIYAAAEDGLLPPVLMRVNGGGTPHMALLLSTAGALALALTGSFDIAFGLIATLNAANGVIVMLAFFMLRRREPELARPYRAIGYPILPLIPLVFSAGTFVLYMHANPTGAVYAAIMWALCVPLAMLARRARRTAALAKP